MYFAPQPPPPPAYAQSMTSMQRMPIPAPLNMQAMQQQQNLQQHQQQQQMYGTSPRYGDSRTPPPQIYPSYSPTSSFRAPMASSPMSAMSSYSSSPYHNDSGSYQSNYMPRHQRQQQAPPLVSADGHIYQVHFKRAHRNFLLSPMVPSPPYSLAIFLIKQKTDPTPPLHS
jgi:hypothetical protein